MKRLLGMLLLLTLVLVGCGEADAPPVTALEKLRAKIKRNEQGEIVEVYLSNTQVTDVGLVHLKGLRKLDRLHLTGTQVTDAGLEHLKGLTNLEWLYLRSTQVTDAGVAELKKALPFYGPAYCLACGPDKADTI